MKNKILFAFLLCCSFLSAQNYTTGVITLTTGYTVKFDTNPTTVTMTLVGPSTQWLGLGIGMTTMGMVGDGLIFSNGATNLTDRRFTGSFNQPTSDATQNWTTTSNNIASGVRTIVATRSLTSSDNTGSDYNFTNGPSTLNLIWALGSDLNLAYHGQRGSGISSNFVLSSDSFFQAGFNMYPNPADSILAIDLPTEYESVQVQIIDILGKTVIDKSITALDNKLYVSNLVAGTYFVKVSSEDKSYTTKLIIE